MIKVLDNLFNLFIVLAIAALLGYGFRTVHSAADLFLP
mgnify:CR=1 FL=1